MYKVYMQPYYSEEDKGDGGIRRVVEALAKYLPEHGIELTKELDEADLVALHGGEWANTNKKLVGHCHGMYWKEYKWPKWSVNVNHDVTRLCKSADAVTAPSEWVADILSHELWITSTVIYHGVDLDQWEYAPNPNGPILWNKTRVDPICDPTPVNELAKLVNHQFVTTFGAPTNNVEVLAAREPYEAAKKRVQECGIYLATTRETFGIGTLEAMAAGKPILGWNWAGQAEIFRSANIGYLAEVGNYKELAEGYEYIMNNYEVCSNQARQCVVDNFQWKDIVQEYGKLYKGLINAA
jgi:glycosyltransferase involved in cell wall biosynthesis